MRNIKRKIAAGVAAGALMVGLIASPAQAWSNINVPIDNLRSPNGYGSLSNATLTWSDPRSVTFVGRLYDHAADGTGPYLHFFVNLEGDHYQQYYKHLTSGAGTSTYVSGGVVESRMVHSINMWVCNGGNVYGYAPKGCYGRRYWNKHIYPNAGSESLGTKTNATGGYYGQ